MRLIGLHICCDTHETFSAAMGPGGLHDPTKIPGKPLIPCTSVDVDGCAEAGWGRCGGLPTVA